MGYFYTTHHALVIDKVVNRINISWNVDSALLIQQTFNWYISSMREKYLRVGRIPPTSSAIISTFQYYIIFHNKLYFTLPSNALICVKIKLIKYDSIQEPSLWSPAFTHLLNCEQSSGKLRLANTGQPQLMVLFCCLD